LIKLPAKKALRALRCEVQLLQVYEGLFVVVRAGLVGQAFRHRLASDEAACCVARRETRASLL
jgi:hypothetical protein